MRLIYERVTVLLKCLPCASAFDLKANVDSVGDIMVCLSSARKDVPLCKIFARPHALIRDLKCICFILNDLGRLTKSTGPELDHLDCFDTCV